MSRQELQNTISELRELRRMREELENQIESMTDRIKAQMLSERTDTLEGVDYRVTWKNVQSSRLDAKALKTAMPDTYARFTRITESKRFVLA